MAGLGPAIHVAAFYECPSIRRVDCSYKAMWKEAWRTSGMATKRHGMKEAAR
jgi:hypothetical protein